MIKSDKVISAEILESLGVYELRELARNLGISSPTTKKREELCSLILKVSKGEQKGEERRTKKGRPPKSVTKISSFVNEFVPEEIIKLQKAPDSNGLEILTLAQNPMLFGQYNNEEKQIYGYVNSVNGHLYIKNLKLYNEFKDLVFYIPAEVAQKFSLREGDKILANGKISDSCYCGIIETILKINNEEIGVYGLLKERKNYNLSTFEIPSVNEEFLETTIKKGERILIFFKDQEEAVVRILEETGTSTDKIIFLGIELAPEIIYYIKSKQNVESFTTSFYNTLDESFDTVINSINHANTLLREGKSIKLIIFDMMGIISRLDLYYSNENNKYLNHYVSSIQMLKKLIGIGKAFSKNLQLTTISVAFENEKNDDFLRTELEKVFSKII